MSVIHRDIKVENSESCEKRLPTKLTFSTSVLMSNDMKVKLADIGAALVKPKGKVGRWGIAGVCNWRVR